MDIKKFVNKKNKNKILFTPGPAPLLTENIKGLSPVFGRGDDEYSNIEYRVLEKIKKMTGKDNIVTVQGSSSLSLEIAINNFVYGNILVISTGYYSERMKKIAESSQYMYKNIKSIHDISWKDIKSVNKKYDWILFCYVETSMGLKLDIKSIRKTFSKSKLLSDATASIGLEKNHYLSDVLVFNSCKGLFGFTGASFISYNETFFNKVDSFYMNIETHINKLVTGPYHTICSLDKVLDVHDSLAYSVKKNKKEFLKKMKKNIIYNSSEQPLICTLIDKKIKNNNKKVILYEPRLDISGSIVCHLGEVNLKKKSKGNIIKYIK